MFWCVCMCVFVYIFVFESLTSKCMYVCIKNKESVKQFL